jgi:hypothetical protein
MIFLSIALHEPPLTQDSITHWCISSLYSILVAFYPLPIAHCLSLFHPPPIACHPLHIACCPLLSTHRPSPAANCALCITFLDNHMHVFSTIGALVSLAHIDKIVCGSMIGTTVNTHLVGTLTQWESHELVRKQTSSQYYLYTTPNINMFLCHPCALASCPVCPLPYNALGT